MVSQLLSLTSSKSLQRSNQKNFKRILHGLVIEATALARGTQSNDKPNLSRNFPIQMSTAPGTRLPLWIGVSRLFPVAEILLIGASILA